MSYKKEKTYKVTFLILCKITLDKIIISCVYHKLICISFSTATSCDFLSPLREGHNFLVFPIDRVTICKCISLLKCICTVRFFPMPIIATCPFSYYAIDYTRSLLLVVSLICRYIMFII